MPNSNITPAQISHILEEFFKVVGTRQYIGARYVPIFGRKGESFIQWDNSAPYEPLTVVLYQGNSYTSRQYVPEGVEITDELFWAPTGTYNAQVEQYRLEVLHLSDSIVDKGFSFDTVADMKESDSLYVGATCHTDGFHESGDGGSAWYLITDAGVANGMDVIACGSLLAVYVPTGLVCPEQFGARGDGVTDDADYIQSAFDYAKSAEMGFTCNKKTYAISHAITLLTTERDEGNNPLSVDFGGATFKAIASMDEMLLMDTGSFATDVNRTKRSISNLLLDCNELANYGVYHKWGRNTTYSGMSIHNARACAFYADGQVFINGLFIDRRMYNYRNIGIQLNMSDNKLENVRIRDSYKAVVINGASTFCINVHPWMINEALPGSICFECNSSHNYFIGCYADTYETSFKFTTTSNQYVIGSKVFINPDFYNDETDATPPTVFDVVSSTAYNEVKIIGFEVDCYNYRLATSKLTHFTNIEVTETANNSYAALNKYLESGNIDNRPVNYTGNTIFDSCKYALANGANTRAGGNYWHSVTPSVGDAGSSNIGYVYDGLTCQITGRLVISTQTAQGAGVLTGLPKPKHETFVLLVSNSASDSTVYKCLLSTVGNLGLFGATSLPAGTYLVVSNSYVTTD